MKKESRADFLHEIPTDVREAIIENPGTKIAWENITLLARNEWICWVTSAKKTATRRHRIERMRNDLINGKRRPCCWPGCPHRQKNSNLLT